MFLKEAVMIRIAICDDEEFHVNREAELVKKYMIINEIEYEIVTFSSGQELLEKYDTYPRFDIIFLDIVMNDKTGIETAQLIRKKDSRVYIVYITAYIDFALDGYKTKTFRYILKNRSTFEGAVKECLDAFSYEQNYCRNKLHFRCVEGELCATPEEILLLESIKHKVHFKVLWNGELVEYTYYGKLDEFEEMLKCYGFVRCHKSFLVNLRFICTNPSDVLKLDNGMEIPVARSKRQNVQDEFLDFWGRL